MKLHQNQKTVRRSGDFESNGFTIEASAKAFMILSDGLYSNKVKAVVRELSTNAYDAHIEAGCPTKPFDVHVPSRFTPEFYIRDYGTGMSHEQCMTLYTTYFRSTKSHSNDAVGCLGLGSKSPFAYADAFTVIAYQNGEKRVYAAHKGEDGSPSFALLDRTPTDEADGMKVSLTVDKDDIGNFKHEMANVYLHFQTKPNFVNVADDEGILIDPPTVVLEGEGWEFNDSYRKEVIMGQIAYTFASSDLDDSEVVSFLDSSEGLTLRVNIGDVDITPSRESLSMNQTTKDKITGLVRNVMTDVESLIQEKIAKAETLFHARETYLQLCRQCSSIDTIMADLETISWKDQRLFDRFASNQIELTREVKQTVNSKWRGESKTKMVSYINYKETSKFVHFDCKGGLGRLRAYLKDLKQDYGYDTQTFYIVPTEQVTQLLKDMGDMPEDRLIKTSDLPKVTRASTGGGRAGQTEIDYYDVETDSIKSRRIDMRKERNCVYVTKHKNNFYIGSGVSRFGANAVKNTLEALYDLGILGEDQTVYFMTEGKVRQRKVAENPNWTSIDEFTVFAKTAVEEMGQKISVMLDARDFMQESRVCELMEELDWKPTGEIGEVAQALLDTKIDDHKVDEFLNMQRNFRGFLGARGGWPTELGKPRIDLDKMLHEAAPMMKFAPRWFRDSTDKKLCLEYLKKELDK